MRWSRRCYRGGARWPPEGGRVHVGAQRNPNRSQPRRNRSPATTNYLMKPIRMLALLLAAAALGLLVTACGRGSDSSVPDGAVAVVDGDEITRGLDELLARVRKTYEANGRDYPKPARPVARRCRARRSPSSSSASSTTTRRTSWA